MRWFGKIWKNSRDKGQHFERLAEKYLANEGLKPLARNVVNRYGEIDLIMLEGDCTVFIEVKYRRSASHGGARYALGVVKQRRLQRAVSCYVSEHCLANTPLRIDFVAIEGQALDQITWIKNAI